MSASRINFYPSLYFLNYISSTLGPIIPLSSSKVYSITFQSPSNCEEYKCSRTLQFDWLAHKSCFLRFFCPEFNENICANHGLEVSTHVINSEDEETKYQAQICGNKLLKTTLNFNNNMILRYWTIGQNANVMKCYLWCDNDGSFPRNTGKTGM